MKILEVNEKTRRQVRGILSQRDTGRYTEQEAVVQDILARVREEGDRALFDYTERFDHITLTPETAEVTEQEIAAAYDQVPESLLEVIRSAHASIRQFHEKQRINSWFTTTEDGTFLGQKVSPLSRAGVYVPGGKAAYPSSVLMNIVPARVAGVGEIIMTTPVGKQGSISPAVLVAAREAGVDRIFKVGGAQAIAALAYGTETIPRVDKI
ncbi:MAG: histidinol dehydrogenase, partial [Eubacterium sp.]|nr:histidinol dehydrogenase [Eubacterium sp.]